VRSRGDGPAGDSHSMPHQEEPVSRAFYRQLAEVSFLPALILTEDFNHPDICWKSNTALSRHSRNFLLCASDNFIM